MEKLKNGDYCENLTKEQFDELIEIDSSQFKANYNEKKDIVFVFLNEREKGLYTNFFIERKTKLSFEDFKNRAINTFKK